ncbi:hypothetical protein C8J56DRAFT_900135 [Mycena floridula]|nr:hypothetical protein C8J56DRAFT_900135 [Mycena floridula]
MAQKGKDVNCQAIYRCLYGLRDISFSEQKSSHVGDWTESEQFTGAQPSRASIRVTDSGEVMTVQNMIMTLGTLQCGWLWSPNLVNMDYGLGKPQYEVNYFIPVLSFALALLETAGLGYDNFVTQCHTLFLS